MCRLYRQHCLTLWDLVALQQLQPREGVSCIPQASRLMHAPPPNIIGYKCPTEPFA